MKAATKGRTPARFSDTLPRPVHAGIGGKIYRHGGFTAKATVVFFLNTLEKTVQKPYFCLPKVYLLPTKSTAFAHQKYGFWSTPSRSTSDGGTAFLKKVYYFKKLRS